MNKQCLMCGKTVRPEVHRTQVAGSIDRIEKPTGVWRCSCGSVMRSGLPVDRWVVKLQLNTGPRQEYDPMPSVAGGRVVREFTGQHARMY